VHRRSVALLIFIFALSAVFAAYVHSSSDPTSKHDVQPPTPFSSLSYSTVDAPSFSKAQPLRPSTAPGNETFQPQASGSASEMNRSQQDVQKPSAEFRQPVGSAVVAAQTTIIGSNAVQSPNCSMHACARAYRSFDAGDCTYQPANGPRRVCRK
jgi:hypothetical protein